MDNTNEPTTYKNHTFEGKESKDTNERATKEICDIPPTKATFDVVHDSSAEEMTNRSAKERKEDGPETKIHLVLSAATEMEWSSTCRTICKDTDVSSVTTGKLEATHVREYGPIKKDACKRTNR